MLYNLLIFFFSLLIFLTTVGNSPLRNWDEAWYGEIIKNMASGNYDLLIPFWNGQHFFDKPPLYFWLTLPLFKIFGAGELQTRLISILAGAFAILLTYLIAKKIFNRRVGIIGSVVFLTLGQVVVRFSHGNLDALLVASFLATFYFYLLSNEKPIWAIPTGISLGLGFLIKGFLLGLFPLLPIFIYLFAVWKKPSSNLPIIFFMAILSSFWWFITGAIKFGPSFINWYILNPLANTLNGPPSGFSMNYFYYFFRDLRFWLIMPLIFIFLYRKFKLLKREILFSLTLTILIFIFALNFLNVTFDWYILPIYPFAAILVGYASDQLYNLHPKTTALLIIFTIFFQTLHVIKIENIYPDRSKVGTDLGKYAQNVIPKQANVVLDDKDFTSFLFYSNQQKIYVVSQGGGKPNEWWMLKYNDLTDFIKNNSSTWIITPNLQNLPFKTEEKQIKSQYHGYYFLQLP